MVKITGKKENILIVLAPLALGAFLYFLLVPVNFILFMIIGIYAFFILSPFVKKKSYKDDMMASWEYLVNWWKKFRKEDLSTYNARAFERYFGNDKFIAFVVKRGISSNEKSMMPLIAVVKASGEKSPAVADWDDFPRSEKLENPFIDIAPHFSGTPSPSLKPELEPVLRQLKRKVKKEKKEEEEVEAEEGVEEE